MSESGVEPSSGARGHSPRGGARHGASLLAGDLSDLPGPILADPNPGLLRGLLHATYDAVWILALILASPWWVLRSIVNPSFRVLVRQKLFGADLPQPPSKGDRPRLLIHGVSVGEVKVAAPLVRELAERYPEYEVLISAATDTGLEVARQLFPENRRVRFPLDQSWVVRRFLRRIRPECVVLIELEIWPNFLRCCNRSAVPVAVVNGRITEESFGRYQIFRDLLPQFSRISLFCAQDQDYARRFHELALSTERVLITGNMKADGMSTSRPDEGEKQTRLVGARPGQPVIVAGSTHDPEEVMVTRAWSHGAPAARLVLVPRHPERSLDVARALESLGQAPQLLTHLRRGREASDPARPLLVDTIGELEGIYFLASIVFVGGSLVPHGGQNMLEPAAQGRAAVLYGPNVDNFFQEAALLEDAGASSRVRDEAHLTEEFRRLLADESARERMARAGRVAVQAQSGATAKTVDALSRCCLSSKGSGVLDTP